MIATGRRSTIDPSTLSFAEPIAHPMMTICHSRIFSSSTKPALNPSTGFFSRSKHLRQHSLCRVRGLNTPMSCLRSIREECPVCELRGAPGLKEDGREEV